MVQRAWDSQQLKDWLALVDEPALRPELPVCDPHHHNWDRPGSRYEIGELHADLHGERDGASSPGHTVVSTVFVECSASYRSDGPPEERPLGETAYVARLAAESDHGDGAAIRGIVGYVDLRLGERARPILEEHVRLGGGRFRGIRHAAGWDADPQVKNSHTDPPRDLYQLPEFRRGVQLLGAMGLVCDAWQYHTQLAGEEGLVGLARACPETTLVLNHCGGPIGIGPYAARRTTSEFDRWRRGIDEVAACPNVVVKLGGITMPRNGFDLHLRDRPPTSEQYAETVTPWIVHCLDAFGPERSMFESNFPVDKVSVSYRVMWNAFKRLIADRDEREQRALLHDNAVRVYSLDRPANA